MEEKIGKVRLNLDYYSGKDLYSDGKIEDELLDIVKNYSKQDYNNLIKEKKSWPILYHLSEVRENILNWFPFSEEANILEVGSGCGAISGLLAKKAGKLTAIELSKKRSLINAYKNKEHSNFEIMVGNFENVVEHLDSHYDYITLIGVLEYSYSYMSSNTPIEDFLIKIKNLLKDRGKVIIAIENKLGLKYFAGCKEDHVGMYFEGLEGYPNTSGVCTFSKKELNDILLDCGYDNIQFYYPYPDYKLPEYIFSDDYLPTEGVLNKNIRNFDSERTILFDEDKVFNSIIAAGLFPEFSNSYLVIADRKL